MATNYPSDQRELYQKPPANVPVYQNQPPANVPVYQNQPPQQNIPYQYAQPVVQPVVQPAIVAVPQVVVNQPVRCRTVPIAMNCPFCHQQITTNTLESFNCKACCVCCITGFIIFACIQCINDKDIGCTDCEHRCPICGNLIGKYYAM